MTIKPPTEEERDMALTYASVFLGSDSGRKVLADLRRRFGIARKRFNVGDNGRIDHTAAAIVDGECNVTRHIETALIIGAPSRGLAQVSQDPIESTS